ncbi:hypothetical protein AB4027_08045 [Alkalibacterium putridalgicola]|uniref:hypothetical protein n=1 Tax=Alkalibacterium putridalgicola TaxID=426703 RepID=UPI0034CD5F99
MSSRIQKKEEEKIKKKERKKISRKKRKEKKNKERKLNKTGRTAKKRSKEMDRYRLVEKRLNLAIIIVALLLLIVLSYVFFI